MRRITTSLNIDPAHLAWLKKQEGGMANYINKHVEACLLEELGDEKVENKEGGKVKKLNDLEMEKIALDEERVRLKLRSKPGVLANIKKQSDPATIVTKAWLVSLQQAVLWENPKSKISITRLRAIAKEEVDSFDDKEYESGKRKVQK